MAILNDQGQMISYHCPELLQDVTEDAAEFKKAKTVYAICKFREGVKIVIDYDFSPVFEDKLNDDEWVEKTNLGRLLGYLKRLDKAVNIYENIIDLYECTGWSYVEFEAFTGVDRDTLKNWIGNRTECKPYIFELLVYKIERESFVWRFDERNYPYDNLTDLLQATGWTQSRFAEYFGIPQRTVQNWKREINKESRYLLDLMTYKLEKEGII